MKRIQQNVSEKPPSLTEGLKSANTRVDTLRKVCYALLKLRSKPMTEPERAELLSLLAIVNGSDQEMPDGS